jgi:hypothetical protein
MTLSEQAPKNGVANKVALVALGCPKNTVDAEVMLGDLQKRGFSIVRQPKDADVGQKVHFPFFFVRNWTNIRLIINF